MIPLTRPISLMVHEPVADLIKEAAEQDAGGNQSDYIRILIYTDLLKRQLLKPELLGQLS